MIFFKKNLISLLNTYIVFTFAEIVNNIYCAKEHARKE